MLISPWKVCDNDLAQINLNESNEMKDELEKENTHFKKMVTSLKQKLDKSKEANVMLKV